MADRLNEKISIVIIAHNEERYIKKCLESILAQTYKNLEILAVDSASSDNTADIIKEFARIDKRIGQVRLECQGYATARNAGLGRASGESVFFIDADCIATQDWVENGLKELEDNNAAGVSGLTHYVSKDYRPSVRDRLVYNKKGDVYPTCNIAYKKEALERVGSFNSRYDVGLEDWDMAFRVLRHGKIIFSKKMLVFHQGKSKELNFTLKNFDRIKGVVFLIKDHYGNPRIPRSYALARICTPGELIIAIFPPALFFYYILARKRINLLRDLNFIFFDYFTIAVRRVIIWNTAIKEKIFLI